MKSMKNMKDSIFKSIVLVVLPFIFTGCGLIAFPHSLKMPSQITVVVRDYKTNLDVKQATVSYGFYRWENWLEPMEYDWEVGDACLGEEENTDSCDDLWDAQNQGYGLYQFSQKTKIGWSKFWGIGPLGSWIYDTYVGYYSICAPGYYHLFFNDSLHSHGIVVNDFISFEEDKIVVYLVPVTESIPVEKRSSRNQ